MPITLDGTLGVGTPGITLAGSAITASANQLNSSAEDVNSENRIINGDFNVWQRGTSSAVIGYVAADRWANAGAGGTITQSRQVFSAGDMLGSTQPTYYLRQTVSGQTLPASHAVSAQNIEFVRSYAGQTVTVLGWARRSSGAGNMAMDLLQVFGAGGSPNVTTPGGIVTLGSSWAPFASVMMIPSIVGKSLGTIGTDYLQLALWASAGSDFNSRTNSLGLQTIGVDLWGIHIRVGTWTAADTGLYRPRDPGTELALCQRYYAVTIYNNRFVASGGGQIEENAVYWPQQMRGTPATSLDTAGVVNATAAIQSPSVYGARAELVSTAAGEARLLNGPVRADAEI